jgi:uncharacterized membrane protein
MEIINTIIILISMFLTIILLDYLWLGVITKDFIKAQWKSLVKVKYGKIQVKLGIGLITWFIIATGAFIFVVNPSKTIQEVIMFGAIFGFISYAIYDLTNLTFIHNYPVKFVFVDIAWGTFLCSAISLVGYIVRSLI